MVSLIIPVYGSGLAQTVPSLGYHINSDNELNRTIRLGTPEFVLINAGTGLEMQRRLQRIFGQQPNYARFYWRFGFGNMRPRTCPRCER